MFIQQGSASHHCSASQSKWNPVNSSCREHTLLVLWRFLQLQSLMFLLETSSWMETQARVQWMSLNPSTDATISCCRTPHIQTVLKLGRIQSVSFSGVKLRPAFRKWVHSLQPGGSRTGSRLFSGSDWGRKAERELYVMSWLRLRFLHCCSSQQQNHMTAGKEKDKEKKHGGREKQTTDDFDHISALKQAF